MNDKEIKVGDVVMMDGRVNKTRGKVMRIIGKSIEVETVCGVMVFYPSDLRLATEREAKVKTDGPYPL